MRIMREIPPQYLIAGTKRIDLRKEIEDNLRNKKNKIKEIRFREIGLRSRYQEIKPKTKLKTTEYKASNGKEYFLEFVNSDDILFALCRLRIYKKQAIIRELHVYGKTAEIGKTDSENKETRIAQHKGLGKYLLEKAEFIAKKNKIPQIKKNKPR